MRLNKKTYKEVFHFDDKWFIIIGIPFFSFIISLVYFPYMSTEEASHYWDKCFPISLMYTVVFWLFYRWIAYKALLIFPDKVDFYKRIVAEVVSVFVFYFLIIFVLEEIEFLMLNQSKHGEPELLISSIITLALSFMILTLYEAVRLYTKLLQVETEKEKLEKENMQSALLGLRNQINPHFLFNNLNTLSYLIPPEATKAQRFVDKFAKVYRYILEIKSESVIPLTKELEFLDSYVYLLKERFGDNLKMNIDIESKHKDKFIVPLSLQMLVENAIKHNITSSEFPLKIDIMVKDKDIITVKNNLQRKEDLGNSNKIGLQNIKNRYQLIADLSIKIEETIDSFIVELPLITVNPPNA